MNEKNLIDQTNLRFLGMMALIELMTFKKFMMFQISTHLPDLMGLEILKEKADLQMKTLRKMKMEWSVVENDKKML